VKSTKRGSPGLGRVNQLRWRMAWFFIAYACIFLIVLALVVLILWESR
jgi:heme/copper-type cytochrome/quinol oxidase subunit 2